MRSFIFLMGMMMCTISSMAQKHPNVIVIYSDDQGAIDLNCYGSKDLETPNIDKLARSGTMFTNFYASPVCSPSRASLLTGLNPQRAGLPGNASELNDAVGMPTDRFTMAEMFKSAGYATAHIGKWHLGYKPEMAPNAQGFDYSFGHMAGCIDNYSHFFYWNGPNKHDLYRNGKEVHYPGQFFPDLMVKEAGQFMSTSISKPFFMYFAINLPHYPYQGDPKWLEYYNKKGLAYPRNVYAAFMSTLDDKIGQLLKQVSDLGLTKNTIIIFQSDNGYSTEERAHFGGGNAGYLRGAKASLFEGGIKVPSIISWPGKLPAEQVRDQFSVNTDWFPTLAELCNIKLQRTDLDGKSLVNVINNTNAPTAHEQGYCWAFKKMWVARKGKWKLLGNPLDTSNKGVLNESDSLFLVDLDKDPGEKTNLASKYPDVVNALTKQYKDWEKMNQVVLDAPYPKIRIWTSPSKGEEPRFNSPSFQWPSTKKATYSVRLSPAKDFISKLIEKDKISFAIFNPHIQLSEGKWYWQYKTNDGPWNEIDSFVITTSTRKFPTPDSKAMMAAIPPEHPRVLVKRHEQSGFRVKSARQKEAALIIQEAKEYLSQTVTKENDAYPTFKGKDDFENEKIGLLSSRATGWKVQKVLNTLSQAYLLTGDPIYFQTAKIWMLEVAAWDPNGQTHKSDFGDAGIMSGLAIGVDTFWERLTDDERKKIIQQVTTRANQFYSLWIGQVESRSSSMHVWQHILHNLLQTSLSLHGEVPEAKKWLEYIYELWIAQSPKMAEEDGAWFNGTSYFGMNTLTLIDVSSIFKDLTGVDFMRSPWFKNNPRWLTYSFPPNSVADGFCNDGDRYSSPNIHYAGYTDAMARLFNDSYAAWYSKTILDGLGKDISEDDEFRWFRLKQGIQLKSPMLSSKQTFPQAAVFPEIGLAYMHTTLQKSKTNLMLSMRSSPFASMAHTHADQNTFNIAYGGKRLFFNSGYRPAMGDPHFLDWHKHTQGHNAILIDGKGQPFNASAFGYIPRFLHGNQISYAVGDASNAYAGHDEGQNIDHGMKISKRHYLMLRPSTIVIYDELEADHPATWSWLLHNDNKMILDSLRKTISARNESAQAQVSLFSSSAIDFKLSDQFSVPVDNWTNKVNEDGDTVNFKNQWHFKAESTEKKEKMRYLAIIQVKPDGSFLPLSTIKTNGEIRIGDWHITAEMDETKPAIIKAWNADKTAMLVSAGSIVNQGKTFAGKDLGSSKLLETINGKPLFKEAKDEIPASIKRLMLMNQQVGSIKNN
jgi:arylsulfatase A-like enzyme